MPAMRQADRTPQDAISHRRDLSPVALRPGRPIWGEGAAPRDRGRIPALYTFNLQPPSFGPQIALVASPKGVGDGAAASFRRERSSRTRASRIRAPHPRLANSALYRKIEPPT